MRFPPLAPCQKPWQGWLRRFPFLERKRFWVTLLGGILLLGAIVGAVVVQRGQKLGYFQASLEETVARVMMMRGINATGLLPTGTAVA
jgi:hypothetical protein